MTVQVEEASRRVSNAESVLSVLVAANKDGFDRDSLLALSRDRA